MLLFGEVKTSSDDSAPPGVMRGGSGMAWQLEQSSERLDVQHALLKWLHARCRSRRSCALYKEAVQRYLASEGQELVLVGILMRDTVPRELDLKARGRRLSTRVGELTRVELIAWYLPIPVADWPAVLREVA